MGLTQEMLRELGLTEEQAGTILEAHGAELQAREEGQRRRDEYARLLRAERVPEKYISRIVKIADLDALDMDGERVRDEAAARAALRREWGDYIPREVVRSVGVDTPPAVAGPRRMSVQEIMAIKDDARRQREIARHHQLFGF